MTVMDRTETGPTGDSKEKTVVKLCLVQTKSLQECSIIFEDAALASLPSVLPFPLLPPLPLLPPHLAAETNGDKSPQSNLDTANTSSPKDKANCSNDDLAEAASKISLISPNQFKPLIVPPPQPDIVQKDEDVSSEQEDEPEADDEDDESEYDDGSVPKLESVNMILEKDFVSGNSSPSREVATILSTDDRRFEDESPNDQTLHDSPSPDFHSTKMTLNSSGTIFPNPPSVGFPGPLVGHLGAVSLPADYPAPACSQPSLETLVVELQQEVRSLRQELANRNGREEISAQVEAVLAGRLDAAMNRTISLSLNKMEQNLKVQEEKMISYISKTLNTKIDQILTIDLKRNVAETVNRALEPLKTRIDSQIGHKLANADQVVRESVFKIVSNPGFQETITKNVALSLKPVVAESYKEVLQSHLPGMERMMKQTLFDMNQTFLAGTKEYESVVRSRMEASEVSLRDEFSPFLRDIVRSIGNLTATQNKLSNQVHCTSSQTIPFFFFVDIT